jgi:hypothetical protein
MAVAFAAALRAAIGSALSRGLHLGGWRDDVFCSRTVAGFFLAKSHQENFAKRKPATSFPGESVVVAILAVSNQCK